jgi:uncharacterized protein (TIGR03437 family)
VNPSSQTFVITNLNSSPAAFRITSATFDGNPWLQAVPTTTPAPIPAGGSQLITVQPDIVTTALPAGVYYGTVLVEFQGFHRDLNVLMVVSASGSSSSNTAHATGACTPTMLLPIFSSFLQDFSVPAAWPIPLVATVVDDCGNPQTSGRVAVGFSNGDPLLSLLSTGNGNWAGTWFGGNAGGSQLTVTLSADTDTPKLHGSNPYTGTLQANNSVPALMDGGVASAGIGSPQAPISPGEIITIQGSNLAFGQTSGSQFPLGTTLGGNQILMAGELLPVIYSSSGTMSAVVPNDISPNAQYSLIAARGDVISDPQMVTVAATQPAVFVVDAAGDATIPGKLWTQVTSGVAVDPAKAAPASAVAAGDSLIIYCTGLGAVSGTPDVSLAAPTTPVALLNPVSVSIGGVAASVSAAGLVPGYSGIYQIKVAVPTGVASGSSVPLVVSSAGQSSAAVNMPVH